MDKEEFDTLLKVLKELKEDVFRLQKHEVLMRAVFLALKDLAISNLAEDRNIPSEEAAKAFHVSVDLKYEELILRIGDYAPEVAKALDMHQNREGDWLSD